MPKTTAPQKQTKNNLIAFRLSEHQRLALDALGQGRSKVMRAALDEYLAKMERVSVC